MIGCVPYLNARPLIHGIPSAEVLLDVPSRLARDFAAGGLDAALLPVFAVLQAGGGRLVDGVAIACLGEVRSVLVVGPEPLAVSGAVYEDPSSVCSNALLRVLAAEFLSGGIRVVAGPPPEGAARVVIGDPALEIQRSPKGHFITDLGEFWFEQTGLPFVFAAWQLSDATPVDGSLANRLRDAAVAGQSARKEIAAGEPDPEQALDYLTRHIRYTLGREEKAALRLFIELARQHGILKADPKIRWE